MDTITNLATGEQLGNATGYTPATDEDIAAMAAADRTTTWMSTDKAESMLRHGLDTSHGAAGFSAKYYGGWHQLGKVFRDDNVTAIQLLRGADADYEIFRSPVAARVSTPIAEGSSIMVYEDVEDPYGMQNIMRRHPVTGALEILGQASKDYPLWTNQDIFVGFADQIIQVGRPTASTCGVLRNGRQAFMSFELPEEIVPGGLDGEGVRVWMVVDTSYDQRTPTTARLTTIRPVCANTLRAAKAQQFATYKIKKTKNADLKVRMAQQALDLVPKFADAARDEWEELLFTPVTNAKFEEIVKDLWGPQGDEPSKAATARWEKKFETLRWLFEEDDTVANVRGTGYAAVNAVTKYADWATKVKPGTGMTDDAVRFARAIEGEKSNREPKINITAAVLALA